MQINAPSFPCCCPVSRQCPSKKTLIEKKKKRKKNRGYWASKEYIFFSANSHSSVPVLFFNMPVPVQRLLLTWWGNKNLVLGGTGEGGSTYWGIFPCGNGNFFPGRRNEQFFGCLPPSSQWYEKFWMISPTWDGFMIYIQKHS